VFSDRDLTTNPGAVETALEDARVFGSLLFDYDQGGCKRLKHIPIRLVFESAIELLSFNWVPLPLVISPRGCPNR